MSLTLIRKPIGHKLSDSDIDAVIIDDGQGVALVYTGFAHTLSDGDYVYIESNFDAYNGFKYVDSISYDSFKIKDSEEADYTEFIQEADISYRTSILNHGVQCVHLPIVYELESSLSPTNVEGEDYQPVSVISQSDDNGYTRLALSGALTDPTVLSKIEFVGSGELAGVYQILTVYEPWNVTINLAYDVDNSFTPYIIVKYYDNYAINVRVWAGLESNHRWQDRKPFELATTLKLKPDGENKVKFSISKVLQSYVTLRNNLTLDTLPNNLDFVVSFYIQYFESYDQSDGEEISTATANLTTDDFTGHALNAKLPFKSESISHLSNYINEDVFYARWLTLFDRPIVIVDRFFDLSFINQFNGTDLRIVIDKYLDEALVETEELIIENPGLGIIRVPLTPETGTDQYCLTAYTEGSPASGGVTSAITLPALSAGVNIGSGTSWNLDSNPDVSLTGSGLRASKIWANEYSFLEGYDYTFTPSLDYSFGATASACAITFYVLDESDVTVHTEQFLFASGSSGTLTTPIVFTAGAGWAKYGFKVNSFSFVSPTDTFDINSITATEITPVIPAVDAQQITERICIEILEECDNTLIQEDNIRLTEDGDFRVLE